MSDKVEQSNRLRTKSSRPIWLKLKRNNKNLLNINIKNFKNLKFKDYYYNYQNYLNVISSDNLKNINYFKKSYFIIEDHSEIKWKAKSILEKKFFNLVKKYFNIEIIYPTSRNPFQISELLKPYEFNEDELWLMMSENRGRLMQWLVLRPKK